MKHFLSLLLLFAVTTCINAQETITVSGTIKEAKTNETLIGVTIIFPELQTGTTTNEYGFYSITIPKGTHNFEVSFIGFKTISENQIFSENTILNYKLEESIEDLDEVIIKTDSEQLNIGSPQMSVNTLKASTIKDIPVVFGEADVIKAITLLPGVTNAGEGSSGFNVRGGPADQNLILLAEATIYTSSHLFGFFSIFTTDAIKDHKLYKC